jgi:hypothetical protein
VAGVQITGGIPLALPPSPLSHQQQQQLTPGRLGVGAPFGSDQPTLAGGLLTSAYTGSRSACVMYV